MTKLTIKTNKEGKLVEGKVDFIKDIEIKNKGLDGYPGIGVPLTNPSVEIPASSLYEYLTFTFYEDEITQAVGKGIPKTIIVDRDCWIDKVYINLETAPGAGKTLTVDINLSGTTIFTTQGNRPSITGSSTSDEATPNMTYLSKNDKLTMDIDTHDGAADKLTCYIRCYKKI